MLHFRLLIRDTSSDSHDSEPKQSSDGQSAASHHTRGTLHPGVICDGCKGPIYGIRFKCLLCPDYDLCSACEGTSGHLEHNMVAMPNVPPMVEQFRIQGRGFPLWTAPPFGFMVGIRMWRRWWKKEVPLDEAMSLCDATTQPTEQKTEEQAQPTSAGNNGECQWSSEQHKSFLHNIGETVNSFLGPLGIKVDVDVVEDKKTPSEGTDPTGSFLPKLWVKLESDMQKLAYTWEDQIQIAVAQLMSMGYEDEGGWLTELVKAKKRNIERVLEALHPSQ
eukprot:Em0022g100a